MQGFENETSDGAKQLIRRMGGWPLAGDKVPTISLEEQLATFINTFQNDNILRYPVEGGQSESLPVNHEVTCSLPLMT